MLFRCPNHTQQHSTITKIHVMLLYRRADLQKPALPLRNPTLLYRHRTSRRLSAPCLYVATPYVTLPLRGPWPYITATKRKVTWRYFTAASIDFTCRHTALTSPRLTSTMRHFASPCRCTITTRHNFAVAKQDQTSLCHRYTWHYWAWTIRRKISLCHRLAELRNSTPPHYQTIRNSTAQYHRPAKTSYTTPSRCRSCTRFQDAIPSRCLIVRNRALAQRHGAVPSHDFARLNTPGQRHCVTNRNKADTRRDDT